jgi:hypothetical protein
MTTSLWTRVPSTTVGDSSRVCAKAPWLAASSTAATGQSAKICCLLVLIISPPGQFMAQCEKFISHWADASGRWLALSTFAKKINMHDICHISVLFDKKRKSRIFQGNIP